jgi:putative mycofactocin binding protein MftB
LSASFDASLPYRLHPQVALRPEPFGALAYHYGNRRLVFLRSPDLVDVVRELSKHSSAGSALEDLPARRRPSFLKALASLEASEVITRG